MTTDILLEDVVISKELLQKSVLKDSFFDFVQYFWDTVIPEKPVWNWHISYICKRMQRIAEQVFRGKPKKYDLAINVPPGSTKSTICSVMFPAWVWTNMPTARVICSSYSSPLSLDLSRRCRNIIRSDEYVNMFGIQLSEDQDTKGHFENTQGGYRYCTSTGGTVTGYHAHFIIVDDPLNPQEAVSDTELKKANVFIRETLSSRKVDKNVTPTVLIMQRLHEEDPTNDMLGRKKVRTKHINLPAEINEKNEKTVRPRSLRKKYKPDPDKEGTKLLDLERLPRAVLEEAMDNLFEYGYSGQYLQNPVPLEGGIFKADRIRIDDPPVSREDWQAQVRFWDKAGTKDGGAYTVGVLIGKDIHDRFWVLDVVRGQWDSFEREQVIKQTAQMDAVDFSRIQIGIEQEPGSGGKESAHNTIQNLAGFDVEAIPPAKGKEIRAVPFSQQVNGNNMYMPKAEWNKPYISELKHFPNSKYKDQVDASSGAFTILTFSQKIKAGVW